MQAHLHAAAKPVAWAANQAQRRAVFRDAHARFPGARLSAATRGLSTRRAQDRPTRSGRAADVDLAGEVGAVLPVAGVAASEVGAVGFSLYYGVMARRTALPLS